jgi:hypothetical protein
MPPLATLSLPRCGDLDDAGGLAPPSRLLPTSILPFKPSTALSKVFDFSKKILPRERRLSSFSHSAASPISVAKHNAPTQLAREAGVYLHPGRSFNHHHALHSRPPSASAASETPLACPGLQCILCIGLDRMFGSRRGERGAGHYRGKRVALTPSRLRGVFNMMEHERQIGASILKFRSENWRGS